MGINQLFNILITNQGPYHGKTIGNLGREISLSILKNNRICIDASGMIYSSILAMREITALTDSRGDTTAHINTILNKVLQLNKFGIQQIWVFDSPIINPMKQIELENRRLRREKSNDPRVQFKMTSKHVDDIKKMLIDLGIMIIIAPPNIEAEQYCAWLTQHDTSTPAFCKYVLSNDSDVLAFGGNLLRSITTKTTTGKSSKTIYLAYDLNDILESINFTYLQFTRMCVVMGTDFNEKTPRVGVKTVMNKIYTSAISVTNEQFAVQKYFMAQMNQVTEDAEMICESYNEERLLKYLAGFNFNIDRVKKMLSVYKPIN